MRLATVVPPLPRSPVVGSQRWSGLPGTTVIGLGGVVVDRAGVLECNVVLELVARHEAQLAVGTLVHVCHGHSVALLRSRRGDNPVEIR